MQSVTSADGTRIAYERHGSGRPVVCLHGSSGSRETWDRFVPHLADDVSVVVPDRRGRGDSVAERRPAGQPDAHATGDGNADDYALDREVADVVALVEAVADGDGGAPVLFGHSFGGLCALEAARELRVDRLVLYEPSVLVGPYREEADLADRMQARLDERVDVGAPTLLLTGEGSPAHLRESVRAIHDAIPGSRLVEMAGVGHAGVWWAPERVAREVRAFLARG